MLRATVEAAIDSGQSIIADIEVLGAAAARKAFPENVISIFIQPPSIGTLVERMRERGEREGEIAKRLLRVPMELDYAYDCPYIIMNDSFEHAADLLNRIVVAELDGEGETVKSDTLVIYRFKYTTTIIPIYRDEALRRTTSPNDLIATVGKSEIPHRAALRCMQSELGIRANESALLTSDKADGDYIPPVALEYSEDKVGEHVNYVYLYCLDQHIDARDGWTWTPVDALPENVRLAISECAT
jgi:hypothetical protein